MGDGFRLLDCGVYLLTVEASRASLTRISEFLLFPNFRNHDLRPLRIKSFIVFIFNELNLEKWTKDAHLSFSQVKYSPLPVKA
jgi:hypothetical protein